MPIWQKKRLGDFLTVLTDYHANGSYERLKANVSLLEEADYAVMIRTTNFEQDDFSTDLKFINQSAYEFLEKSKVIPGDILMNKIANPGSVYIMPDLGRPVSLAMNLFLLRTDKRHLNQTYAYYYLKAHEAYVKSFATGAATATITKEAVRNLEIIIPDIDTQHQVSSILAKFDRLLLLNKQKLLLADKAIRELFSHFCCAEKNTNGKLPNGWVDFNVESVFEFLKGVEPGRSAYCSKPDDDNIQFIRVGDLSKRDSVLYISKKLAKNRILQPSDVVVSLDGTVGVVRYGLSGSYSGGVRRVRSYREDLTSPFIYSWLKSDPTQATIKAHANGATILHAGGAVKHLRVIVPDPDSLNSFNTSASPFFELSLALQRQNHLLTKTRDLLLPKLISGELDVSSLPKPEEVITA